jgi:hypothetical protein
MKIGTGISVHQALIWWKIDVRYWAIRIPALLGLASGLNVFTTEAETKKRRATLPPIRTFDKARGVRQP